MSDDLSIPNPSYRGTQARRYGTGQSRTGRRLDPDTRRLALFASGLGVVLVALIAGSTLIGRRGTEVPVITADTRPIRVKPDNPGGMKIDGAENDVFSAGSDLADAKLAPPPENPDAKALRPASAPPVAVEPPAPPPAPSAVTTPLPAPPAPVAINPPLPTAIAPPPSGKPAQVTSVLARPAPQLAPKPQVAAAETHPSAPGHQIEVQLAALTSEEAARDEWQLLSKRLPDLLNGRQPDYSRTERDGHTFWRIRTSGFADMAQARTFCDHIRAKGGGCSVADF
ncbi:SPOR domain-containing protein [Rhodopila sp.]|uniref:SPOR domain-containing protein n=1 Tax=Rhodopila sp. TaxID=2480087 RepID=UPI003D0C3939